jgi:3-hexulose-6-phosphate synthase
MTAPLKTQLQVALDAPSTRAALELLQQIHPFVDIVEIGTPLLIEEGLSALEILRKEYPDKRYLADTKIMDAGYLEAASAFRRGADIVTVLAVADNATIEGVLRAAREHGKMVMADFINAPQLESRAQRLEAMGADMLCLHTAFDRQGENVDVLSELHRLRPLVTCGLAVAGGLNLKATGEAIAAGANVVVIGGAITSQTDPRSAAQQFRKLIQEQGQP